MTIEQIIAAQPLFIVILEFIILVGAFLTTIGAGIRWLTKHYFDEIKAELKPNSGSSIKDQVTRLEKRQEEIEKKIETQHSKLEDKIDKIFDTLLNHLSNKDR